MNVPIIQSNYFVDEAAPKIENVAALLKGDLFAKIEMIRASILNGNEGGLSNSKNILHHSVECILVEGQPFFKNDGQCLGASEWLMAQYLHVRKRYPEIRPQQLLRAIIAEFSEGVGIQGAFLQKYQKGSEHKALIQALDLEEKQIAALEFHNVIAKDISNEIPEKFMKKISELEDGIYRLSFSGAPAISEMPWGPQKERGEDRIAAGHATVIAIEKGEYYFHDNNVGLISTSADKSPEEILQDLKQFFSICLKYTPRGRSLALFFENLNKLPELIGADAAKRLSQLISAILPVLLERDCLSLDAYLTVELVEKLAQEGFGSFDELFGPILTSLSLEPGILFIELAMKFEIRFCKYECKYT